jgi:2-phospho-L-lactate guanylyltransferase
MTKAIIIPYRGTISDKSRLHTDLNIEILEQLLYKVTQHVISEALRVADVDRVYVLTQKSYLKFQGNYVLLKDKGDELNSSVLRAIEEINEDVILIVMADLPLITSEKIDEILQKHIKDNKIILAPTKDKGTSIICFHRETIFPGVFGKNSSIRFKEFFENHSVGIVLMSYNETYRDIDTLKDLIKIASNELLPNELHPIFQECVEFERKN